MSQYFACVATLILLCFATTTFADQSDSSDPVEAYRRQIEVLRDAYQKKIRSMEKDKAAMAAKFTELAKGHRDDAIEKLKEMTKKAQATDLDEAIRLRDAATALAKEQIPKVKDDMTRQPTASQSSTIRRMKAQIDELESMLNKAFRLNEQLLINGSFEQIPRRGVVSGWQSKSGNWALGGVTEAKDTRPAHGNAFLYPGVCALGKLTQDVDISTCAPITDDGDLAFQISAVIRCFRQRPPDTSEMRVEFLDSSEQLLKTFTTGQQANAELWMPIGLTETVPKSARIIRVTLLSERHGRRTRNNNGYFDNVQLVLRRR